MEAQAGRERCQRIGQTTEPLRGECHAPPPHHRAGGVILRVYIGPSQSQGWEVHAKAPGRGGGGGLKEILQSACKVSLRVTYLQQAESGLAEKKGEMR